MSSFHWVPIHFHLIESSSHSFLFLLYRVLIFSSLNSNPIARSWLFRNVFKLNTEKGITWSLLELMCSIISESLRLNWCISVLPTSKLKVRKHLVKEQFSHRTVKNPCLILWISLRSFTLEKMKNPFFSAAFGAKFKLILFFLINLLVLLYINLLNGIDTNRELFFVFASKIGAVFYVKQCQNSCIFDPHQKNTFKSHHWYISVVAGGLTGLTVYSEEIIQYSK